MKTRILHTEFWKKMARYKAPKDARYLYNYLLTNMYINMCGIFELPDEYILLETGLTQKELEKAKLWLSEHKKAYFNDGWVKVANAEEYNKYSVSPKNTAVYERELKDVPIDVSNTFDTSINTTTDTSMGVVSTTLDTNDKSIIINKKPEIINHNRGVRGEIKEGEVLEEKKYSKLEDLMQEDFEDIAKKYRVSTAFVLSKYDAMENWAAQPRNASKVKGRHWRKTLMDWVREDAVKVRKEENARSNSKIAYVGEPLDS